MSEPNVIVMGLGNLLWADEGFGIRLAERLYAHYHWPESVEIVDGGTQGLNLLGYVEQASHLLLLDAIDYGLEPGTLQTYAGDKVPSYLSAKKMSLHQNSFSEVLALADIRGHLPAHIALVGLQPVQLDDYGMSEPNVIVMGLGNLLWADEGFGIRLAERLYAHYHWPESVEIVDGGTQGLNLLGYVEQASHLLLLDAIDYGLEPGTLQTYAGDKVPSYLSAKKMSLHQNSFSEVLALADIRGHLPAHIALVGLQPVQLDDYGGSLTDIARAQLPAAEQAALTQLAAWGIAPQTSDETRCLNYDCLSMENYEGVRIRQYRVTLER